jgi:protein ImuB
MRRSAVVRLACAEVRCLDLQLLLRRRPEWQGLPVAVVSRDSPQGIIHTVNRRAREAGVFPGLSYAAGLSFTPELRGGVVSRRELSAGVEHLSGILRRFSPGVEVCELEPGVFWLDIRGLVPLYSSVPRWGAAVHETLRREGFRMVLAAGFTRFGCYAAAKASNKDLLFDSPAQEKEAALRAPLEVLKLAPEVLERLKLLGVATIEAFLALPPRGLRKRFGPQVEELYDFAAGGPGPLVLSPPGEEVLRQEQQLPEPAADSGSVLTLLGLALEPLLGRAQGQRRLVRSLLFRLQLEDGPPLEELIAPAVPTREGRLLRELLALRLQRLRLPARATGVQLQAASVPEGSSQRELFAQVSEKAREEAVRAFARLRAVYGSEAVQIARLQDEHLPEQSFTWESPERPGLEQPDVTSASASARASACGGAAASPRRLVRRFLNVPRAAGRRRLRRRAGPFLLSGRWWAGERPRLYYYGEDAAGELLWMYQDAGSPAGGFLIGIVE